MTTITLTPRPKCDPRCRGCKGDYQGPSQRCPYCLGTRSDFTVGRALSKSDKQFHVNQAAAQLRAAGLIVHELKNGLAIHTPEEYFIHEPKTAAHREKTKPQRRCVRKGCYAPATHQFARAGVLLRCCEKHFIEAETPVWSGSTDGRNWMQAPSDWGICTQYRGFGKPVHKDPVRAAWKDGAEGMCVGCFDQRFGDPKILASTLRVGDALIGVPGAARWRYVVRAASSEGRGWDTYSWMHGGWNYRKDVESYLRRGARIIRRELST